MCPFLCDCYSLTALFSGVNSLEANVAMSKDWTHKHEAKADTCQTSDWHTAEETWKTNNHLLTISELSATGGLTPEISHLHHLEKDY